MSGEKPVVAHEAPAKLLVVERRGRPLALLLDAAGYRVVSSCCGPSVLPALQAELFDLVVIDLCAPGLAGLVAFRAVEEVQPNTPVLLIAEWQEVDTAVTAMKEGAADFIAGRVDRDELLIRVERALARNSMIRELATLRRQANRHGIVGQSTVVKRALDELERIAPTRTTVLILGETGTGKELFARALHRLSPRAGKPFVPVHCASLPPTMIQSELFGHVRGSFTGATGDHRGLLEQAHGGTLFLDEVSTMPEAAQVALLRVLEDHAIYRIGSSEPVSVDFRLVAATNADLAALVERGDFRSDLFYRLNVYPVSLPPLRDRVGDIPPLVQHFLLQVASDYRISQPSVAPEVLSLLALEPWPGNVRQLRNWVERAVATGNWETPSRLQAPPPGGPDGTGDRVGQGASLQLQEDRWILEALARAGGNRTRAARALGIDRRTLHRKLKRLSASQ